MPAKSQQQLKYIWAMRNKYGSKKKTPSKMKWVFDREWTEGVKMKKLPIKVEESRILSFEKFVNEENVFDFSQTLPITTKNFLTNYYSCDECDGLWKVYNEQEAKCKFCGSEEIEEISEVDWYEVVNQRMGDEDDSDVNDERKSEEEEVIDLLNLKKEE
jgi:hypothetical protein